VSKLVVEGVKSTRVITTRHNSTCEIVKSLEWDLVLKCLKWLWTGYEKCRQVDTTRHDSTFEIVESTAWDLVFKCLKWLWRGY